ncbi:hypothetical protein SMICM17S_13273 [Streptomyces microflavus]
MEDVAAGQAQIAFEVERGLGLDAGFAVLVEGQAVGDRLLQVGVEFGEGGLEQGGAGGVVVGGEEPGRGVQAEEGQGLVAARGEVGAEDRGVGQRVAVDLGRRGGGEPAGRRVPVGVGQLPVPLGDVERTGEGLPGVDGPVPEAREPGEQHVHLELGALGGRRWGVTQEGGERLRGGVDEHAAGGHDVFAVRCAHGDLGMGAVGLDPGRLVPYADLGARRPGGLGEGVGEGAHAADGDVPVTGSAADHVVEEAPVLEQRGVVGVGEGADQGVGQHHAAYQVIGEVPLDGHPDGLLEQGPPGLGVVDPGPQRVPGGERLGQGREDPFGDPLRHGVEALPGRVLPLSAGQRGEGLPGPVAADEQPGGAPLADDRGVGGDGPLADGEVQPEIADDLPRQQGDQIGVAREAGVDAGEGPGRDRRSPGGVQAFQDEDGLSGAGEVGGGDQTVVAAAHDHGVVAAPGGGVRLVGGRLGCGRLGCGHAPS